MADISRRTGKHVRRSPQAGGGTTFVYRRTIFGALYAFRVVVMPDAEVRYFVSRFNGYIGGPGFSCAWDQVHDITVRACDRGK